MKLGNGLYEIGFAIGKRKPVGIIRNRTLTDPKLKEKMAIVMTPELSAARYSRRYGVLLFIWLNLVSSVAAFAASGADYDWKLVAAAQRGDEHMIQYLLDSGADPSGQAGAAAVVEAAKNRHAKVLGVLLSRGASANASDREYSTPRRAITLAAEAGSEESVAVLLRHGASPSTRNEYPFRFSFEGTSPSRYVDNHKSALMYAAEGGYTGVVRLLLKAGARPNAATVYDETALMFAAGKGHSEATRVLIQAGADLNATASDDSLEVRGRGDYGGTALAYALRHAHQLMLRDKARGGVGECREHLETAYEIVSAYEVKKRHVSDSDRVLTVGLLCSDVPLLARLVALRAVKRGSDVLLILHATKDSPEAVELLIRAGADVNAREKLFGETPLMRATSAGSGQTVRVLLDAGAEINATTSHGESALWHAAQSKQATMVSMLLARGADLNLTAKPNPLYFSAGGTALDAAVQNGCTECASELLRRGARRTVPDALLAPDARVRQFLPPGQFLPPVKNGQLKP